MHLGRAWAPVPAVSTLLEHAAAYAHHYVTLAEDVDVWIIDFQNAPDGDHGIMSVIVQPSNGAPWTYPLPADESTGIFPLQELAQQAYAAWRDHIEGEAAKPFFTVTRGSA